MIELSSSRPQAGPPGADPAQDIVQLRNVAGALPVFAFPGLGGDPQELAELAARLRAPAPFIAVRTCWPDEETPAPPSVQDMASRGAAAIALVQPHGPYRLVGYSFGGLVAIETARLLRERGEEVELLALVDTIFDHRFWPAGLWIGSQLRRTWHHLEAMRSEPIDRIASELAERGGRLMSRLARRLAPARKRAPAPAKTLDPVKEACRAAMAHYRPTPYPGVITLLKAERDDNFACDVAKLWRALTPSLDVRTIPGAHGDAVRDPEALNRLAGSLDALIHPGRDQAATPVAEQSAFRPKALIMAMLPWQSTARLALAFSEAGFDVEALCPGGHVLTRVDFVGKACRLDAVRPLQSLRRAIEGSRPDLIVPCDDPSAAGMRRLHEQSPGRDPSAERLRGLISRSLGEADSFRAVGSRAGLIALARAQGVMCPETSVITDAADVRLRFGGPPLVLKADGASGGRGVAIVGDADQAVRALERLAAPPSAARMLKRLIIDRDPSLAAPWMRRTPSVVNAQDYVAGAPATATAACWRGEVLAMVMLEVVQTLSPTGPATVVRTIDHPGMARATRLLVHRLGLSGFCGLDFIIDGEGAAHLIELNPRATPTAHLRSGEGVGLVEALRARLLGRQPPEPQSGRYGEVIALFPGELARDPESRHLRTARHDVPSQSPQLVRLGLARARRERGVLARSIRRAVASQGAPSA
jgi:thioesterase domain-containing protein